MQVKISQAVSMVTSYIKAGLVPMIVGSPGMGKSQLVYQIAKNYNLKVIDIRLSQCDPTDLMGFPTVIDGRADYVPMKSFPIEGDEIPAGYDGWLLFFDEANGASLAVQKAMYKVLLDRKIGMYNLHKNVAMVCAGNLETDGAAVETMSTALQSRMVHLEVVSDVEEWIDWANSNGIDKRITSFMSWMPGNLYTFKPDHTESTYACGRTWEFVNQIMKVSDVNDPDFLPMVAGAVSYGVAGAFYQFCKIHESLPKMDKILADPLGAAVPVEPSIMWATTGALSDHAAMENADAVIQYVRRMPMEFQVVTVKAMCRKNFKLFSNKSVAKWVADSGMAVF